MVGGEEGDEDAGAAEEVPGVDDERDDGADEKTFAYGEVLREESGDIIASGQRVFENGGENCRVCEASCDEETACAVGRAIFGRLKHIEEGERIPDYFSVDHLRGRRNEIADDANDEVAQREASKVAQNDIVGSTSVTLEICCVGCESSAICGT